MIKITFCLLALFFCINNIFTEEVKEQSLQCYECNSITESECRDPFASDKFLKTCESGQKYCRKTIQYGKLLEDKIYIICFKN